MQRQISFRPNLTKDLPVGALVAFLIPFVSLIELAREIFVKGDAIRFDCFLLSYLHNFSTPALDRVMLFFTFLGSVEFYLVVFPITLALLAWRRRWWELGGLSFSFIGALLFNNLLKIGFHRVRPNLYFIKETGYSFPSGHAMVTLVFYGVLLYFAFRHISSRSLRSLLAALALFLVLAIGVSRIYLGVHYPSDVLGSYLAGFCWLVISIIVVKQLHRISEVRTRSEQGKVTLNK